jgi:hypothetical protein
MNEELLPELNLNIFRKLHGEPSARDKANEMSERGRTWNFVERLIHQRDTLIRERDEARAKLEATEAALYQANEQKHWHYERGVREAAKVVQSMRTSTTASAAHAILNLLEPKLSDPPHNEEISETAHTPQKPDV